VKRTLVVIVAAAILAGLQMTRPDQPGPGSDCELVTNGIFRQPGNASTAVVLLLAGVVLFYSTQISRRRMGAGMAVAGTASTFAHTTLHPWALAADGVAVVISIVLGVLALREATIRPRLMIAAAILGSAAITLWVLSRSGRPLCDPDAIFTGHAGWHVLIALAAMVAAASLADRTSRAEDSCRSTLEADHGPS
jgi:hypothetical protein